MTRRRNTLMSSTSTVAEPQVTEITYEQAVKSFLLYNRIRNLSDRSLGFYEYNLAYFKKVLAEQGLTMNLRTLTAKQVKEHFIGYMLDNGLAGNTINGRIKSCKAFFAYLCTEGIISHPLADQINLVKAEKKMIQTFTKEQMLQLLDQPNRKTFTGFRDYAIMMVLLDTGMRVGELVGLTVDDVNFKEHEIRIKLGKGRKARRVPIQKTCAQVLEKYIVERGEARTDALFVTIDNEPLKLRSVQENITEYGKQTNLTSVRVSPHTFRHTMAKFYILNGGDAFTLQRILGHTTLEMVKHYVELFSSDIREQHQKYSPVENMGLRRRKAN
jgi:integrase/recombinase XerD